MYLNQLRIEYQKNPIGIDCRKPRFPGNLYQKKPSEKIN